MTKTGIRNVRPCARSIFESSPQSVGRQTSNDRAGRAHARRATHPRTSHWCRCRRQSDRAAARGSLIWAMIGAGPQWEKTGADLNPSCQACRHPRLLVFLVRRKADAGKPGRREYYSLSLRSSGRWFRRPPSRGQLRRFSHASPHSRYRAACARCAPSCRPDSLHGRARSSCCDTVRKFDWLRTVEKFRTGGARRLVGMARVSTTIFCKSPNTNFRIPRPLLGRIPSGDDRGGAAGRQAALGLVIDREQPRAR